MKPTINKVTKMEGSKFLSLYQIDYTNKIGNPKNWNSASRLDTEEYIKRLKSQSDSRDAVLVAAYHKEEKKLAIIKQYRVPINRYIYEIPAGLVEKDEEINTCVERELKEETGLELIEITENIKNVYMSPGMTDECADVVFCTCKGDITNKFAEEDEDITVMLISQEEAGEIIKQSNGMDLKTLLVLKLFNLIGEKLF